MVTTIYERRDNGGNARVHSGHGRRWAGGGGRVEKGTRKARVKNEQVGSGP